jgi:rhamnosyltransferase subunit B
MGDILGRVGLDRPGALAAMIGGWDAILAAAKPDLVVADFAPALLTAARGRVPTVLTGAGFACPAASLDRFPVLGDGAIAIDETELLDIADADLRTVGRDPLNSLPALFAADHDAIASFAVLDPYRDCRSQPHCAPVIDVADTAVANPSAEDLFVYFYRLAPADAPLWQGLALSGRKVRIHFPDPTPDHLATFRKLGLNFEKHPLRFDRIAAQSRLALSHGGQGFVSSCLLTGLPQIVAWYDLEKKLAGQAVSEAGLGRDFNFHALTAGQIAEVIEAAWTDTAIHGRAADARRGFVAVMGNRVEDRIADLIAS